MEPCTMTRDFQKQDVIDGFHSCIWTERYYGDSTIELVVPATSEMIKKLPKGVFLCLDQSEEVMIAETISIESGKLKVLGQSVLPWLNNRFVRASSKHDARFWRVAGLKPGHLLWNIVQKMCVAGSPYLNGTINTGITNPSQLAIPGLGLYDYDKAGSNITVAVPYGPVYKAMRDIAVTYKVGMQILLMNEVTGGELTNLGFRSYRGLDRTTAQTVNSPVRFSPVMDSLTDIKEIQSIAALKTAVWAFAPGLIPKTLQTTPGVSRLAGEEYTGFDLRAHLEFAEDIDTDVDDDLTQAEVRTLLKARALKVLKANPLIQAVDGEIVPTSQFKYGKDYSLGDLIEVQGNTGITSICRVIEYIRAQDDAGEREYPTVQNIEDEEVADS
jgi:hypothetical protein